MGSVTPMAFYGLTVPAGDILIPASKDFPASFRITMAAIDPSAEAQTDVDANGPPRATLKIIRDPAGRDPFDDDEDSDDDEEMSPEGLAELKALLAREGALAEDESDEDEEEDDSEDSDIEAVNGGPSDLSKSKKARKAAAVKQLKDALQAEEDEEALQSATVNGVKKNKGKGKVLDEADLMEDDDEDDDEDDEDGEDDDDDWLDTEEFVLCTLDPSKNYQQTLDFTVGEHEMVYFKVSGTHDVHITGNYVADPLSTLSDSDSDSDSDEDAYDLSPDEDELYDEEDEEDELDDLADPRIMEIDDAEEAPVLIKVPKKDSKKSSNKRAAESSDEEADVKTIGLDDLITKSTKPEVNGEKLTKAQKKKLKNNAGEASLAPKTKTEEQPTKSDKKVQFAKNLEQGPAVPTVNGDKKGAPGIKTLQAGVKIDDKKIGTGPVAKSGNRVSMRYIGKLEKDNKVFDANKKGRPFSFKLGVGEVIKGWDIGVAGMSVGGERRIHIPASQGYGSSGTQGIPPNSNLVFDVKMLEIK